MKKTIPLCMIVVSVLVIGITSYCSIRLKHFPMGRFENYTTISDFKSVETNYSPYTLSSEYTYDKLKQNMNSMIDDNTIIAVVQPFEDAVFENEMIKHRIKIVQIIQGDSNLNNSEIDVYYYGFHIQSYDEIKIAREHGKAIEYTNPSIYHSSFNNLLLPQSKYLVFLKVSSNLNHTIYTSISTHFPWYYALNDDIKPVIVQENPVCSFTTISNAEIFVADQQGIDNWYNIKESILKEYLFKET